MHDGFLYRTTQETQCIFRHDDKFILPCSGNWTLAKKNRVFPPIYNPTPLLTRLLFSFFLYVLAGHQGGPHTGFCSVCPIYSRHAIKHYLQLKSEIKVSFPVCVSWWPRKGHAASKSLPFLHGSVCFASLWLERKDYTFFSDRNLDYSSLGCCSPSL